MVSFERAAVATWRHIRSRGPANRRSPAYEATSGVHAARGGIVDAPALHDALTSGQIAGAALDVFEAEPPPENHPLFALDNVILSPHSAGLSKEAAIRMAISTARNVLAGIDGKLDPSMVVNREVL